MTAIAHHDPVPPNAVHGPRVTEHGTRNDGIDDAHRLGSPVPVARRVEQGEGEGGKEQRDAEPGEEGSFRSEPDLRVGGRERLSTAAGRGRSSAQRGRVDGHLWFNLGSVRSEFLQPVAHWRSVRRTIARRPLWRRDLFHRASGEREKRQRERDRDEEDGPRRLE